MPPLHRLVALVVGVALCAVGLGACTDGSSPPDAAPSPGALPSTALEDLPVKRTSVPREPFCAAVPETLVAAALGVDSVPEVQAYGNGERATLTRGVRDVAAEFSCTWDGAARAQARAWLFAPPTDRALARDLASALRGTRGCSEVTGAAAYGAPSVSVACEKGPARRVLRAGLLGDAWLTCSLTLPDDVPPEELVRRSADWCAGLLTALTGPPAVAG